MNDYSIHTIIDGTNVTIPPEIIAKYNKPLPRYTSYPPTPHWKKDTDKFDFIDELISLCSGIISFYIHIPFCKNRCSFCACNAIATRRSYIIDEYIYSLVSEMSTFSKYLKSSTTIKSLHLGGGTPTYLTSKQIEFLQFEFLNRFKLDKDSEVGIEADPMQTTVEKIKLLRDLGFNRISFGIQDTNEDVLCAAGRRQDLKHIELLVSKSRQYNFHSVNIDLCYGLPRQNISYFNNTLDNIINLSPDRISLFNFAYLPSIHPNQRKIKSSLLPTPFEKIRIFTSAIEKLCAAGYEFIGLDHFAKKEDELFKAKISGTLKRTFQGYTAKATEILLGIGVTSISETNNIYMQNERRLSAYLMKIKKHKIAFTYGFKKSRDDQIISWVLQNLFCQQKINKNDFYSKWKINFDDYFKNVDYNQLKKDALIIESKDEFKVTALGRIFIRNIAALFDKYLGQDGARYSRAI